MSTQGEFALPADDMADLLANSSKTEGLDDKWPVRLAEILDGLVALFQRRGRDLDDAIAEAHVIALWIADNQGGRPLYLPRGDRLKVAMRNREIYQRHNGRNGDSLADEYGMTLRQIQSIIAEQYRLQVRRRQGDMFNPQGGQQK